MKIVPKTFFEVPIGGNFRFGNNLSACRYKKESDRYYSLLDSGQEECEPITDKLIDDTNKMVFFEELTK